MTNSRANVRRVARLLALAWLAVLAIYCLCGTGVYGHGVVFNSSDPAIIRANREYIEAQFNAGKAAEIIGTGIVVVDRTIETPTSNGCGRIITKASGGYSLGPDTRATTPRLKVIGEKGPVIKVRGTGFTIDDPIQLETAGDDIVQIEGRGAASGDFTSTGMTSFRFVQFYGGASGAKAINCLGTPVEDHADCGLVEFCSFANSDPFTSANLQALRWKFRDIFCGSLTDRTCTVVDVSGGGGCVAIDGITLNLTKAVLFKLGKFSQNTSRLSCRDLYMDLHGATDRFLTVAKYDGPQSSYVFRDGKQLMHSYYLDVEGWTPGTGNPLDPTRLYEVPEWFPRDHWHVDLK